MDFGFTVMREQSHGRAGFYRNLAIGDVGRLLGLVIIAEGVTSKRGKSGKELGDWREGYQIGNLRSQKGRTRRPVTNTGDCGKELQRTIHNLDVVH